MVVRVAVVVTLVSALGLGAVGAEREKAGKAAKKGKDAARPYWEGVGVELSDAETEFVDAKRAERAKALTKKIKGEGATANKDQRKRWGAERTCIQKTPEKWFPELLADGPLAVGQIGTVQGEQGTTWFCVRVLSPGRILLRSSIMVASVERNMVVMRPGPGPYLVAEMKADGVLPTRMVEMPGVWRITGEEDVEGTGTPAYVASRADHPGGDH